MTRTVWMICIAAFSIGSAAARAADAAAEPPNNPYGVMCSVWGDDFSDWASIQFRLASDMVGDWGYVRVNGGVHDRNVRGAVRTIVICRANRLIPVMTGLYVPEEYRIPGGGDHAPYVRTDGYPLAAEQYGRWAEDVARAGVRVPYYEVGNEINGKWEPEAYGRFAIAVSRRLKAAMPGIRFVSAGLAGNGADFLDACLTAVPEMADHVDCWGLHPYGANHPPSYAEDGYCLKGHLWTARALAKHGITDPRFVMTESGYELGNKRDHRFPRITDEIRAEYLVEAYETVWAADPRVRAQMLFMIQDVNYMGWNGWILVLPDGTKTRTYEALAAIPKPEGSDWLPRGMGALRGRVTDAETGDGLARTFVYVTPGPYAAETDADGAYVIDGIPGGRYRLHWFRDAFLEADPSEAFQIRDGDTVERHLSLTRFGLTARSLEGTGRAADGWGGIEQVADVPAEHYDMDATVARSGAASQRLVARPGEPVGIWQCTGYATCLPQEAYAAEIWVKGLGLRNGDGRGVVLSISATDSFAGALSTAQVTLPAEGDFDWTPLGVVVQPVPLARRLVIRCELDAEEGTIWIDDPYCHVAAYPLPSRLESDGAARGSVAGVVESAREERMAGAVLCLNPGAYWSRARSDGTYEIAGAPSGVYDLYAFRHDREGAVVRGIEIRGGDRFEQDVFMEKLAAPRFPENAGFEGPGLEVAALVGWKRYGEFDGVASSGWHPELPEHPDGVSARTGKGFAGSIAGSNVKNGGICQTLGVDEGAAYEASVWVYTYQSDEGTTGDVVNRLGVDPSGGTDPEGPYVLWTPYRPSHREWSRLSLRSVAIDDRMTIFLDQRQVHGLMWNLNLFDDVGFEEIEPLEPPQVVPRPNAS